MYRDQLRYGGDPYSVKRASHKTFHAPLLTLNGPLIFTCSWSDFFIEEANSWRNEAWDIIKMTPHFTYQILTKRPANIEGRLPSDWGNGYKNVWLGVSVENQKMLNERLWRLCEIPASFRFVSAEPLLGMVDLGFDAYLEKKLIHWVITGGESGPQRQIRKADIEWFRFIRDQCRDYNIPFFHKQHGGSTKIDGAWGGRLLDGREWNEMPANHD